MPVASHSQQVKGRSRAQNFWAVGTSIIQIALSLSHSLYLGHGGGVAGQQCPNSPGLGWKVGMLR